MVGKTVRYDKAYFAAGWTARRLGTAINKPGEGHEDPLYGAAWKAGWRIADVGVRLGELSPAARPFP